MLDWKRIVQNYIAKHSDKIRKTTQPLRDHFGVQYFTYHRITAEGRYTVLVDRPDWAEHYVSEKYFLHDPYLRHPRVYESGVCLFGAHGADRYKRRMLGNAKKIFNLDLCMMSIERRQDSVEFFGLAGNSGSLGFDKLYANRAALLKAFGVHFKKELGPVLRQMEEEAETLVSLGGDNFFCTDPIHPVERSSSHKTYLKEVGFGREVSLAAKLSQREKECIQLLLEGLSAKETAACLGLSPRTIESYFENIKVKLECWTKSDIFILGKRFEELRLL